MSTPHNSAEKGDIAKTVLMPGDPLRARYIAEHYLEDPHLYTSVRNILGYTGFYKGVRVSVQGSGMGIPSIAIYSYELYHFYDVDNIIRVGTCGACVPDVVMKDLVFAEGASTNSNYGAGFKVPGIISAIADFTLLENAVDVARRENIRFHVGNVVSGDMFYGEPGDNDNAWSKMGCIAGEMESYGLYLNAARAGKRALTILTVSDENYPGGKHASAEERQNSYTSMMSVALETAVRMESR